MKYSMLPFILILLLISSVFAHPIHLSVSEVNYNSESKSIEVAQKVFIDDLEDGIELMGGPKLHLYTDKEHKDSDLWLAKYFQKHIKFKVNEKDVKLQWVGRETDPKHDIQAIWVYMEVTKIKKIKTLEVKNTVLLAVHNDQRNMVHLTCNEDKVSWLFDEKKITETIQW
ncbi:DUF6702 family protein [Flammeovirga kamogawensis]|uniref:Uncharacterized protein n=1 Tax=Flammeovirga kamogawensis TaxID=373891 RepID=A0ABX8H1A8_9BACT|nr:DUF6702 family protein [Flammeovirga kamogawensis]MBB6459373.1 hypothetical protein [Flammeovirga kamogawensis]QWG08930.1 hypothetical protein KM029_08295 [Flammeovirga kamogawensis]TRX67221.1 hypothetical protein EO216_03345 [Flammeovirga kamogawensis]